MAMSRATRALVVFILCNVHLKIKNNIWINKNFKNIVFYLLHFRLTLILTMVLVLLLLVRVKGLYLPVSSLKRLKNQPQVNNHGDI